MASSPITWKILTTDGRFHAGSGYDGVRQFAAEAVAGVFEHPKCGVVVVAGVSDLMSTVATGLAGEQWRAFGLLPNYGARVWIMPGQGAIGIGRSWPEVYAAYEAVQLAEKSETKESDP